MSFKEDLKADVNTYEILRMVHRQERIDFLLDACKNRKKFEALPDDVKDSLERYRKKIENNKALDATDYSNIKDI